MKHMFFRVAATKTFAVAALAFTALSTASQAAVVFDNISNAENGVTGASISATGSTPNTYMGDGFALTVGTFNITGFDLYAYNNSGTSYTGLQVTIYVWGTVNGGTTSATNPAFSNLLNTYTLTTTGTFTASASTYYPFESATPGTTPGISLTTPLAIPSNTVGITVNYQGTTNGTTYASANNLTSIVTYGTAPTVGTQVTGGGTGYYRNANSETNGNFTSTPRNLGTNSGVALRIYGTVPEPGTWAMIVLGAGGLVVWQVRRRSARA